MATMSTALKNAILDLIDSTINAGTPAPTAVFQTAASAEVATVTLGDPAFGAASAGSMTLNASTNDPHATGGIMSKCVFKDGDGTDVITFTVSTSGAEINFANTTVAALDIVGITSLVLSF